MEPHKFSIQEECLVTLALNALQGTKSSLITIQKLSASFSSHLSDRTHHAVPSLWDRSSSTIALGKLLLSIARSGLLVFLLRNFVDYFRVSSRGLVNQAFAVAVGKVLRGYVSSLDTLRASVGFRVSDLGRVCFESGVRLGLSLLDVDLHTWELRTRVEALGNVCCLRGMDCCFVGCSVDEMEDKAEIGFGEFYRGGDLLSYLYDELQVADPAHHALLKFLFLHSCEPYFGFIRSWIFEAEVIDPYEEFIVEYPSKEPHDINYEGGNPINFSLANMRERAAIPCFLKNFLVPIIRAGQQLQVLNRLLEFCNFVVSGDYSYMDFLPIWRDYVGDYVLSASPLAFSKKYLESMVSARNGYYEKLQEKAEGLLGGLELAFEQVEQYNAVSMFDSEQSLKTAAPLAFDGGHNVPPIADEWNSNAFVNCLNSGPLSTKDGSCDYDTSNSSESPSFSDLDEQMDDECPVGSVCEESYFSSLQFSTNKLDNNASWKSIHWSEDMEIGKQENCGKTDNSRCLVPHQEYPTLSQIVEHLLGMSNFLSVSSGQNDECGPPTHLKSSYDEVSREFSEECLPYIFKIASSRDSLVKEVFVPNQLENISFTPFSSMLQQLKFNCCGNFLSLNPMLKKKLFFHLGKNPGENHSMASRQSLPCFDFTCVVDPCKLSIEKLADNHGHESITQKPSYMSDSATNSKSPYNNRPANGGDNILKDTSCLLPVDSSFDLKECNQQAAASYNFGGGGWESLLGSFRTMENKKIQDSSESMSGMSEIPLDFVIEKCLLQEISLQYKYVSKLAIKLLEEGFDLQGHFLALRRYYFMEFADWADLFITSLWRNKWCMAEAGQRVSEIQSLLEMSVQRSSCEQDPKKDLLFVYIKGNDELPLQTSQFGVHSFDFLGLGYRVNWPVSIVLTPCALKMYAEIFSFLVQVKLAVFSLSDAWSLIKNIMHLNSQKSCSQLCDSEVGYFNLLIKIRHQLNHFISALQQYVLAQLSHVLWCRFCQSLKLKVKDMLDLELVLMEYLTDARHICFLPEEMRFVASNIEDILQCAVDFRYLLVKSSQDTRVDQETFMGRHSRINASQVIATKQKFEENMKKLHLCYLKSPKYGDHGLSHLWRYLDYNQYYSDI